MIHFVVRGPSPSGSGFRLAARTPPNRLKFSSCRPDHLILRYLENHIKAAIAFAAASVEEYLPFLQPRRFDEDQTR
jgi:hypothetical protein